MTPVDSGDTAVSKRALKVVSRSSRNLTKFQPILPSAPGWDLSQVKMGCSLGSLTWMGAKVGKLTW